MGILGSESTYMLVINHMRIKTGTQFSVFRSKLTVSIENSTAECALLRTLVQLGAVGCSEGAVWVQ